MAAPARKFKPDASSAVIKPELYGVFIDNAVQEDVTTVPGVGPANAALLEAAGVSTTHQLIGQFLVFRTAGMSVPDHMDKFWEWLQSIKVNSGRNLIVRAIAEKVNILIPGTYDEDALRA